MLSADTLPFAMEAQKAYTDSQISQLEQRLSERLTNTEARIVAHVDERLKRQQTELESIEANINTALGGVSSDIGDMKNSLTGWQIRAESLAGLDTSVRDMQVQQTKQDEAIQTLQSDVYGQPSRGRETIFGMIAGLTNAVETLAGKVGSTSLWIEAETVRQAEARQRWQIRQQAALQLVKVIPVKAIAAVIAGGGSTLFVIIKVLGG